MTNKWIVVTDFDGTLTDKDIGNELCIKFIPDKYEELRKLYKAKALNLRHYQLQMWTDFPTNESVFRAFVRENARFRPGVVEFLILCLEKRIPIYIASCGLRPYIDEALSHLLPKTHARSDLIQEIRCNEATFDDKRLKTFSLATPEKNASRGYSLDKGAWCTELRVKHPGHKILGIGNGTSDQTFIGHTDILAATEGLADFCRQAGHPFVPFEDFHDLMGIEALV